MSQSLPIPEGESPLCGACGSGMREVPPFAWPLDTLIDLSGPAHYEDAIPLAPPDGRERHLELRIAGEDPAHYLFASVAGTGPTMQLSSGLVFQGSRAESWHGVCSGKCVTAQVILRCALKFDGRTYSLEMRVQTEGSSGETLIFGNSSFECPALGPQARVFLFYGRDGEVPVLRPAAVAPGNGAPASSRALAARPNVPVRTAGWPRTRRAPLRPEASPFVRARLQQ